MASLGFSLRLHGPCHRGRPGFFPEGNRSCIAGATELDSSQESWQIRGETLGKNLQGLEGRIVLRTKKLVNPESASIQQIADTQGTAYGPDQPASRLWIMQRGRMSLDGAVQRIRDGHKSSGGTHVPSALEMRCKRGEAISYRYRPAPGEEDLNGPPRRGEGPNSGRVRRQASC